MKNYTLSVELFKMLEEFSTSYDLLTETFTDLINVNAFMSQQGNYEQKSKLDILLSFKEVCDTNSRDNAIASIYNESNKKDNSDLELLLTKYLSVSGDFFKNRDINIKEALRFGFIVEVNLIHLTTSEISEILRCLNNQDVILHDGTHESIKIKLIGYKDE